MAHPRTVIRQAIAKILYENKELKAFVGNRIYVSRFTSPSVEDLPCICLYTKDERTTEMLGNEIYLQDLDVVIEVYCKREPNITNKFPSNPNMPSLPAQITGADIEFDDIAFICEETLNQAFYSTDINYIDGETTGCVTVRGIKTMTTEIDGSNDAEVPLLLGSIKFMFEYERAPNTSLETNCLKTISVDILQRTCGDDPRNGEIAISSRVNFFGD